MRNDFPFLAIAFLLFAFLFAMIVAASKKGATETPPTPATPRQLAADPELYEGRRVLLTTSAFQVEEGRKELAFRPAVPGKPTVVIRFPGPVPDPVPTRVSGVPAGRDPVVVTDIRPE